MQEEAGKPHITAANIMRLAIVKHSSTKHIYYEAVHTGLSIYEVAAGHERRLTYEAGHTESGGADAVMMAEGTALHTYYHGLHVAGAAVVGRVVLTLR